MELVPHNTTRGEYNCLQPRRLSEKTTRRPSVSVHVLRKWVELYVFSTFFGENLGPIVHSVPNRNRNHNRNLSQHFDLPFFWHARFCFFCSEI